MNFASGLTMAELHLTLKEHNSLVQQVKYVSTVLDRVITWRITTETTPRPSEQSLLLNPE